MGVYLGRYRVGVETPAYTVLESSAEDARIHRGRVPRRGRHAAPGPRRLPRARGVHRGVRRPEERGGGAHQNDRARAELRAARAERAEDRHDGARAERGGPGRGPRVLDGVHDALQVDAGDAPQAFEPVRQAAGGPEADRRRPLLLGEDERDCGRGERGRAAEDAGRRRGAGRAGRRARAGPLQRSFTPGFLRTNEIWIQINR